MATGSGQGASPSTCLGVSDLGVLCEVLHPVRSKYKHLGLQIGVDITTIQNIEADHSKAEDRLLEVFLVRLNDHRALTWADIVKALRSRTVAAHQLANSIQTSYGIRFGPTIADQPRQTTHQKSESKRNTRKIASPQRHETEQEQELGKEVRDNLESKMSRKHTRKRDIDDEPISTNSNEEEIDRRENKGTKSYIQSESEFNSPQRHQKVSGKKHKNISRQRIPKYVQRESQSEQDSNTVNSDSTEESYSSEQEEDSAKEVSETERYQKPSEQPREDEYPHSHRETPVRKTKGKRGKFARKYTQKEDKSESERYRDTSEKVQMNINEAVAKKTKQKAKKFSHTKSHLKPEKEYIAKGTQYEGKTKRKAKATKYDKESQVVCGSQQRHKVKHSEQRAQKWVQIESESESSASNSKEETVNTDDFVTAEESYSSEQEEDSAEEVSETERYQKPSEQPRDDEYPHSHRETPVRKTRGKRRKYSDLEKTMFESLSKPEAKVKRKLTAVDQSVSNEASQHEVAGDAHGEHEKVAQECKKKKSEKHSKKGEQKAPRENESESSSMRREGERVSSTYHRGKSRKPKSAKVAHQQKQSQGKKLEYQTKAMAKKEVEKKAKESILVAGEQSSDEEVREKPAPKSLRQKEEQTKSESEYKSSAASTSDDQSGPYLHDSTKMREYHKVHSNTGVNGIEEERAVKTKKETKVTKRKGFHGSDTDMREQSKEVERCTKVNEKMKITSKEKYLKADTSPRKERKEQAENKRISSKRKVLELGTPSSDFTQENSEDEESDSDDSSEDEEDRYSEQKSPNEMEEAEPDDESSPPISEKEEVKRKLVAPYTKKARERKGKRGKIAADLPGNKDPCGKDQEEHDIQPKKRSRRRHRESSMSPTARGSSSPTTLEEDNQKNEKSKKQPDPRRRKKTKEQGVDIKQEKVRRNEEKDIPSSSDMDDYSPECDIRNLTEEECKKLKKVFKRFFGKLCCAIVNPVETAAQLQEKRLISPSMMKDLIMSPESQQSKTISVVCQISTKIGAHPDRLFQFIEVLLDYDAPQLQKVGREMLTEAGNLTLISTVKLLL